MKTPEELAERIIIKPIEFFREIQNEAYNQALYDIVVRAVLELDINTSEEIKDIAKSLIKNE